MKTRYLLLLASLIALLSCEEKKGFDDLVTFSENGYPHFIIINPAGSAENYIYDNEQNAFKVKTENGRTEKINFLPFPANFGFFPSTHTEALGIGELLEGFLLSESYSIRTMMEAEPVGAATLLDNGTEKHIIFSIPKNKENRLLDLEPGDDIPDNVKEVFEIWYKAAFDNVEITSWHTKEFADELIKNRSHR